MSSLNNNIPARAGIRFDSEMKRYYKAAYAGKARYLFYIILSIIVILWHVLSTFGTLFLGNSV